MTRGEFIAKHSTKYGCSRLIVCKVTGVLQITGAFTLAELTEIHADYAQVVARLEEFQRLVSHFKSAAKAKKMSCDRLPNTSKTKISKRQTQK